MTVWGWLDRIHCRELTEVARLEVSIQMDALQDAERSHRKQLVQAHHCPGLQSDSGHISAGNSGLRVELSKIPSRKPKPINQLGKNEWASR